MGADFQFDVFLSHSARDKPMVRELAARLQRDGLRVWLDEEQIKPGDSIPAKIEQGLEHSRVLVLCMSAHAFGSDWAQLEAGTFRFRDPLNRERRFIPLRLDDAPIKGSLAQFLYINWRPVDGEREFAKLIAVCRGEEMLCPRIPATSPQLKSKIEEARRAVRKHDEENAIHLWEEVRREANTEADKATEICARLEISLLRLRSGNGSDEVLAELDKCIHDAKAVELGENRPLLFQLLGEAHRIKGNSDLARGFIVIALEQSRAAGQKCDEGWALLALSTMGKAGGKCVEGYSPLDLIQQAYDCFSAQYTSGEKEKQRLAKEGFAACHSWRAEGFSHLRLDDAMAEYTRALEIFREMGSDYDWDAADILFRRGDLQAGADDPQLASKDLVAAAEMFKKLGDHIKEANCTLRIAELLDQRGLRLESKPYYEAAAAITMQQKDRKKSAWIWFRYACKLVELREFEEAKSIFSTLLKADWFTQSQRLDVLKNLCLVAKATGQKEELERHSKTALEIIDEGIAKATSADSRRKLIISKGHCLEELDEHDRAVACWHRAIRGFKDAHDLQGIIECWFHIGGVMRKLSKQKEERVAYETILSLAGGNGDSFFVPLTLAMLAQLDISEQRFDEARKHLDRAEHENQELNNPVVHLIGQDLRSKLPPG